MEMPDTRPPDVHVRLQTDHPLAMVSAVRHELRRAGADPRLIERFNEEAFASEEPQRMRDVCRRWADIRRGSYH